LVADAVQGILDPALTEKFAVDRLAIGVDKSRTHSEAQELDIEQLCSLEDLLPDSRKQDTMSS
jgi:sarcosine oxidase/L-pipecolate oxidase